MPLQEIFHAGWSRNLRLFNDTVELIIPLEIGPRILSYRTLDGTNIFHNFPDEMGTSGEEGWINRGGHRFWVAPEDEVLCYFPDNHPFQHETDGENFAKLIAPLDPTRPLRKELTVTLPSPGSGAQLTHTLTNESDATHRVAPWALSVMAPGGLSILPQPELGEHPRDLLPNRRLILWPYSDTSDPRFQCGKKFITLRHDPYLGPFKFGLNHQEKWAAYLLGSQLFVKTVDYIADADYPDFGCNYESFTNQKMLEIETLGPLVSLAPGESVSHVEHWTLHSGLTPPPFADHDLFAEWLLPYLPV